MKVDVDPSVCEAHGVCMSILPEVFDLDDEEVLQIREGELADDEVERAERAVTSCPMGALRLSR
ncbi:ferredoxin [Lentzea atacamensis]|jgi:ferredoxin|uniref:Ferredoxin n=2 Tax=Lentzea TaxID=165301 RepID=A0A316I413_9PSEU|nr:ferredoxin [Lentzea atacamensis]PWK87120.1 ferredoxin [Lentzea atacamensis]RAS70172.1 ferredoxin [Lentzea atacamensis]